jgi:UDP-glucose 4-epimerase
VTAPSSRKTIDLPVAVIGAAGFIGMHAARKLGGMTGDLRCFSRRRPTSAEGAHEKWFTGSIADRDALLQAITGCEVVVHLASASTPMGAAKNMVAAAEESIVASLRLFEACVAAGVRRVVYLSSGGTVYGIPSIVPTPEDAPTDPISAYGVGKLAVEHYLRVVHRQHGLDYRILRASNVYGPLQSGSRNQGVVASFVERALQDQPLDIWGDGKVVRDYVYIDDVTDAIAKALVHEGPSRVFNIGSGEGLNLLEITGMLDELLGRQLQRRHHASGPHDVPVSVLDCSRARTELDWRARTRFLEGLSRTLEWRKAELTGA